MTQQLFVHLKPRTSRNRILGWEKPAWNGSAANARPDAHALLCISVIAPATDGRANKMLLELIASKLKISRTSVHLTGGKTARIKRLELPDDADLSRLTA